MKSRIFVLYKESTLDLLRNRNQKLNKKDEIYLALKTANDNHYQSLDILTSVLKDTGLPYYLYQRSELKPQKLSLKKTDLLLTLGGDGTYIYASQFVKENCILGINSAPNSSIGFYCKYNVFQHREKIKKLLINIFAEKEKEISLQRLQIQLNNKLLPHPIINDCLFLEQNPSITARYLIHWSKKSEVHKSSGLWLSTASGSSAAFSSAGGKRFKALNSKNERQFGFISREVYGSQKYQFTKGLIAENEKFSVESAMVDGQLHFDGGLKSIPVKLGQSIKVHFYKHALKTYL